MTAIAIQIVLNAIWRYVGSWMIVWKFDHVQTCVSFPVNASMLQKADTNRTASAAR